LKEINENLKKKILHTTANFELVELVELSFRIKFSLSRKLSGYELPAISKWQTSGCENPFSIISQITHTPKRQYSRSNASCFRQQIVADL
jgi:hypothetical protein